jgi:hypothetical protein
VIPLAVTDPENVDDQLAFPEASVMRNLPTPAPVGIRKPSNSPVPVTSRVEFGVVLPIPILHPVWKRRDEKSQFHPAQNTERYPLDHPVIPLAVVLPENTDDQLASPVASEIRTLPVPGDPQVIFTCHIISSLVLGVIVPIPTFPHPAIGLLF